MAINSCVVLTGCMVYFNGQWAYSDIFFISALKAALICFNQYPSYIHSKNCSVLYLTTKVFVANYENLLYFNDNVFFLQNYQSIEIRGVDDTHVWHL